MWVMVNFQRPMIVAFLWALFHSTSSLCCSLNDEGLALLSLKQRIARDPFDALSSWNCVVGKLDHCSWFGVECSHGKVVSLKLGDLGLEGTLTPELINLTHIKEIILRNNSFTGFIPEEIGQLKQLEVLDFGHNKFSGPFPLDLVHNLSLSIILLDNNEFISYISPEFYNLKILSDFQGGEHQVDCGVPGNGCDKRLNSWDRAEHGNIPKRRLFQWPKLVDLTEILGSKNHYTRKKPRWPSALSPSPSPSPQSASPLFSSAEAPFASPKLSPLESTSSPVEAPSPSHPGLKTTTSPKQPVALLPEKSSPPNFSHSVVSFGKDSSKSKNHVIFIACGTIGGSLFAFLLVLIICFRRTKVVTVKPWATGLSGQLRKAFVTGVPKLNRPELEIACEDFSNIIGSLTDGTVYKGTLSSGVEIAVTSKAVKSGKEWPKNLETRFRNKIATLSKVNHKNFVNLIGYCEEENPFTRMMVFEYAPNGSLFEHLHIIESEHLDWKTRLRIAMGMAYCLEYMHRLTPPIAHGNLQSASVYLTEDYAAKVSDFCFWNEIMLAKMGSANMEPVETSAADPEGDVYSFGVVLLEIITGKLPYPSNNGSLLEWASDHLSEGKPLRQMVDPTLTSFKEEELETLIELIKGCLLPHPRERPTMREITSKLKEITSLDPDGANPKTSPLWWAELEILSTASA
nr:receptor kinase-like protein 1 [Centaurium erythraea]